jgi:catechol 2,3-dioxygenase-like lactoylglutathione lyase family enzyme
MKTSLTAITLFVDDVLVAREFYARAFGLPVHWQDEVSVVFDFDGTLINLLADSEALGLIAPAAVAAPDAGSRMQLTLTVDDVDAEVAGLRSRGVELLNGPVDRSWGVRTAAFADPAGHVWELAQPIT